MIDAAIVRRQAHHRGLPVLRYAARTARQKARAHHGPPRGRPVQAAGAKRMVSIDLHSGRSRFFDGPVDHLTALPVLERYVREHASKGMVIVSPTPAVKVPSASPSTSRHGRDVAFINKRVRRHTNTVEARK